MSSVKQKYYPDTPCEEKEIADYLRISSDARIILGIGPCRVGTKAQLFTMAASGFRSYDQPLKCALRSSGHGLIPEIVNFEDGYTYFKETLGPYSSREVHLDPIRILGNRVTVDWMRKNLSVIGLLRNPSDTWKSWDDMWGREIERTRLKSHFRQSFQVLRRILTNARENGIDYQVYDYERNKNPTEEYRKLFDALSLDRDPVVDGWNRPDTKKVIDKNIRYFREPDLFLPEGMREDMEKSTGIHYSKSNDREMTLEPSFCESVVSIYETIHQTFTQ